MRWFDTMMGHGAWIAQLSGLLLTLSMFGRASIRTRLAVIAAAIAALCYALLARHIPPLAFWAAVVLAVSAFKIIEIEWKERLTRFSVADEHLRTRLMTGLSRSHARALIDRGNWVSGKTGERLLTEGEPVTHLYFLHSGAAAVSFAKVPVGQCAAGDLIGDATAISGAPATATVNLTAASELWCIWADELRHYVALHPEVRTVLERGLNEALRGKLSNANQRLVDAGSN
ncbi:hypothetical protein SPAN111604_10615 [Sphingomonas antarctica]|uniref:Crp/Fnr family transcriptional regulator n=1 Tax=Sphingomonas antarctica TaxID=2040274 RepID=UPI0039EB19F8